MQYNIIIISVLMSQWKDKSRNVIRVQYTTYDIVVVPMYNSKILYTKSVNSIQCKYAICVTCAARLSGQIQ